MTITEMSGQKKEIPIKYLGSPVLAIAYQYPSSDHALEEYGLASEYSDPWRREG